MTAYGAIKLRDWEADFERWASPPSESEQKRCARAVAAIKKAIEASPKLKSLGAEAHAQGSYANRTNVREDSDVDVGVRYEGIFFYDLPPDVIPEQLGISTASYPFSQYKDDVGAALIAHFGAASVKRGNKAFDIHENNYRVDADAVPCFGYRRYYWSSGQLFYHSGFSLVVDNTRQRINNFPLQQHANNRAKNDATQRRFRALVRILKNLRNEMEDNEIAVAEPIPSYLIECLVWNWPNANFEAASWRYRDMVNKFLGWLYANTLTEQNCATWMEENDIKQLFGDENNWTREQVNAFAVAAYAYIEAQ